MAVAIAAPALNGDDYKRAGLIDAWEILVDRCEIPPSLEVFEHQLAQTRKQYPAASAEQVAVKLSNEYQRIPFPR